VSIARLDDRAVRALRDLARPGGSSSRGLTFLFGGMVWDVPTRHQGITGPVRPRLASRAEFQIWVDGLVDARD